MKKSFMNNIKNFVDSNVRQRIDRVAHNNNEFFSDELLLVERHFEDIRHVCIEAEKRISSMLQSIQSAPSLGAYTQNVQVGLNNLSHNFSQATSSSSTSANSDNNNIKSVQITPCNSANLSNPATSVDTPSMIALQIDRLARPIDDSLSSNSTLRQKHLDPSQQLSHDIQQRHKKLPIVGFLKFLVKSCYKLKSDSLMNATLTHCSQLQTQLTQLYLSYEQTIELQCLKPIQQILEVDIPNVMKLRKLFIKSHNDLESVKVKYNGASQKQQQLQTGHFTSTSYTISQSSTHQSNINKLELLKKELDDAVTKFEQARDTYEAELYSFVCRETELVNLFRAYYKHQAEYHRQVLDTIQSSVPPLDSIMVNTPRKLVFGTHLDDHLRCTGRAVAPVIELCTHLLHSSGLHEEGLFRIPGSSVKMKKLKNAINAWFVTIATRQELENDQLQQSGHSCVIALYDLFKNILGHVQETANSNDDPTNTPNTVATSPVAQHQQHSELQPALSFDVHSIAGLLKLYLRELPEPLLSPLLYDQWIEVVSSKFDSSEERLCALARVIDQLPKTNYENLRHLIRFLHLLTCHREQNKMTSSNLAIAMAPSLIWSNQPTSTLKPQHQQQQQHQATSDGGVSTAATTTSAMSSADIDDATAAINNMSSIGMSASLHALILEALINHAEYLFPGQADYTLPGFTNLNSGVVIYGDHKDSKHQQQRAVNSASPTGLSTASSSSFSSNDASTSASSTKTSTTASTTTTTTAAAATNKTHSRKGGSMDGLLNQVAQADTAPAQIQSGSSTYRAASNRTSASRPMSVHLHSRDWNLTATSGTAAVSPARKQNPPPVPPVPLARSHGKQSHDNNSTGASGTTSGSNSSSQHQRLGTNHQIGAARSNYKPPAPPVPQTTKVMQMHRGPVSLTSLGQSDNCERPRAGSLRGTGTIVSSSGGSGTINSIRPSVPPPDRPSNHVVVQGCSKSQLNSNTAPIAGGEMDESSDQTRPTSASQGREFGAAGGAKSSQSDNLRLDLDKLSPVDVDISAPESPLISSGSISSDSSFDNDNEQIRKSFDYSWTESSPNGDEDTDHHHQHQQVYSRPASDARATSASSRLQVGPHDDRPLSSLASSGNKVSSSTSNDDPSSQARDALQTTEAASGTVDKTQGSQYGIGPVTRQHQLEQPLPPIKPPRSTSPKITQSTPL